MAAGKDALKCRESLKKFCAKLPNSTNRLRDEVKVAVKREELHHQQIYFLSLERSCNTWRHWDFRWAAEKKVKEMAAVIEKQAFKIEALKRLYKAK